MSRMGPSACHFHFHHHLLLVLATAAVVVSIASPTCGAAPITTGSLIEEMTDLAGLATFPDPPYTCRQFSSYDPKSKSPANPTTEDWFANGDAGHYLRVENRDGRREYVMMDAAGPGAVVRIWSANPAGTLRVYLDGARQPVLEAPMTDLLGGKFNGLPRPIAGEYSKGWNLYFPIPYARHCLITSDKGEFYYHVNYRTYPPGTPVESFDGTRIQALGPRLERLARQLSDPRSIPIPGAERTEEFQFEIPAGESIRQKLEGPAAITRCLVRLSATQPEAALRGLILRIAFDGEPCVETPLGDFFGHAPGLATFDTLPLGMTRQGELNSRWYMPFRESAVIELVNHGTAPVGLAGTLGLGEHRWTADSLHFHAKWRIQWDVPSRPMIDWNYLNATGRGVFAGVSFAIDNPVRDWWGEGDEKIYVDGESFPSHFGTGTEDYYGYAWCWSETFTHAFHAQPRCDGPGNFGRTSVNRFHVLDRIPFAKSLRFDMELWHWHPSCRVNMAVVAYWYARPGGSDAFPPIRAEQAVVRPLAPYVPPRVPGAIEGESLRILAVRGTAEAQEWAGISGEKQLWWHAGMKPGDQLRLAFPAPRAGTYRVLARFLAARDYGTHRLAINGRTIEQPFDFYLPEVRPTEERLLGEFALKAGDNELVVTVVGANPKAVPAYMFGLDYLMLKPVD